MDRRSLLTASTAMIGVTAGCLERAQFWRSTSNENALERLVENRQAFEEYDRSFAETDSGPYNKDLYDFDLSAVEARSARASDEVDGDDELGGEIGAIASYHRSAGRFFGDFIDAIEEADSGLFETLSLFKHDEIDDAATKLLETVDGVRDSLETARSDRDKFDVDELSAEIADESLGIEEADQTLEHRAGDLEALEALADGLGAHTAVPDVHDAESAYDDGEYETAQTEFESIRETFEDGANALDTVETDRVATPAIESRVEYERCYLDAEREHAELMKRAAEAARDGDSEAAESYEQQAEDAYDDC